ncbi:exopolysaccharide biosynthesis polyprenyl glycosylphosphotransferase [Spirochaeta thermophila DSM 6578]|uniref:Exopolysaccharide biosynthesis polyprenyl glycosylphosphotransferase n=1 Tax=Winmispira thermophila (strain ATCC 700085 / DSM 6578 / Z-1203) TaxID=869211 RepID=G0GB79_WINT7|nr:sugar transferase [Spirochaeta thermophila]AEJ61888.1 exopolysaccharide biosynthesis polyprenyl glycosylphosphotransferase [Spirochaeta thermophila DSM 6578]
MRENESPVVIEFSIFRKRVFLLIFEGLISIPLLLYIAGSSLSLWEMSESIGLHLMGFWILGFLLMVFLWPFLSQSFWISSLKAFLFAILGAFLMTGLLGVTGDERFFISSHIAWKLRGMYAFLFLIPFLFKPPNAQQRKLAVVPLGIAEKLLSWNSHIEWEVLNDPTGSLPKVEALVVDFHYPLPQEWLSFVAQQSLKGTPIYHAVSMYEQFTGRVPLDYVKEEVFLPIATRNRPYRVVKRVADIIITLAIAPVLLILLICTGLVVLIDAGRPILFIQERVGERERLFKMVKFRTMRNDSSRPSFTQNNDTRITRTGKFLRKFRLDEIPQFWNVLKGEMSIVGPRPEQKPFVEEFKREIPFYSYRHLVPPGISGWAQVQHGYAASVEDTRTKLEYDLFYIKNQGMFLDLYVLFLTIRTILTGFGAR